VSLATSVPEVPGPVGVERGDPHAVVRESPQPGALGLERPVGVDTQLCPHAQGIRAGVGEDPEDAVEGLRCPGDAAEGEVVVPQRIELDPPEFGHGAIVPVDL
jgi:hypothetical protein